MKTTLHSLSVSTLITVVKLCRKVFRYNSKCHSHFPSKLLDYILIFWNECCALFKILVAKYCDTDVERKYLWRRREIFLVKCKREGTLGVVFHQKETAANIPYFTESFKCLATHNENLSKMRSMDGYFSRSFETGDVVWVIKTLLYFSFCHVMRHGHIWFQ
jgi:hypothetical protein